MSEETKSDAVPAGTVDGAASVSDPNAWKEGVAFPSLKEGPRVFHDEDRKEIWVGIPLNFFQDPLALMLVLDNAKTLAYSYFQKHVVAIMKRKQFEASPEGGRIAQMLKGVFSREKSIH